MLELFNPKAYYPIIRRFFATAPAEFFIDRTRTSAEVAEWCKAQFSDSHVSVMHYLRIERRLGRAKTILNGRYEERMIDWERIQRITTPGHFIIKFLSQGR